MARIIIFATLASLGLVMGCEGDLPPFEDPEVFYAQAESSALSCADPRDISCCPGDAQRCYGDPDEGVVCVCTIWMCGVVDGEKQCRLEAPKPAGLDNPRCSWSQSAYHCDGTPAAPLGSGEWGCGRLDDAATGDLWRCTRDFPPTPIERPDGAVFYACSVDNEFDALICKRRTFTSTRPVTDTYNGNAEPSTASSD
jgi:hypothetical protein